MKTLRATPTERGWKLALMPCVRDKEEVREEMARAFVAGREILLAWFKRAENLPEACRLEAAKAAIDDGEIALGLADELASRCCAEPTAVHEVSGAGCVLSPRTVRMTMQDRGLRVVGRRGVWCERAVGWTAALVASTLWLAALMRNWKASDRLPRESPLIFAVHGEDSTRTRHLLALLGGDIKPSAVLVLGRPQLGLSSLRELWTRRSARALPPMMRPYSVSSALRSLPAALALLRSCMTVYGRMPWLPVWHVRVGQMWRCLAGSASANWWLHNDTNAALVVFGHTGTADTTLLERSMQSGGTSTVHAVHGLSGGLNFVGYSDLAIWRCGFDADWHAALGTYGHCFHEPATRPAPLPTGSGERLLVVSNLAHPMNILYRLEGPAAEIEALESATRSRVASARWRPHPVFYTLPADVRSVLLEAARRLHLVVDDSDADLAESVRHADRVCCTPSTTVAEVMQFGRMPELVGDLRWASHVALRQGFDAARAAVDDNFEQAWAMMRPSTPLAAHQFHALEGRR